MADLYVLAVDLPTLEDPKKEAYKYKAGDVIAVLGDGEGPGRAVEICSLYKVVRVPGPPDDWAYLMANRPFDPDVEAPRRLKTLDITTVYAEAAAKGTPHEKMPEMISIDTAAVKAMEKVTEAKSGDLVIG